MDMYRDIYDFAPICYLSLDPEGNIVRFNQAAAEFLGGGIPPYRPAVPATCFTGILSCLQRIFEKSI